MKNKPFVLLLLCAALPISAASLQWYKVPDSSQDISNSHRTKYVPGSYSQHYDLLIEQVAREHKIDPLLLHAIIAKESAYRHDVMSNKGAIGLMQLIPNTAARYGKFNLTDPRDNLEAGASYLVDLLRRFDGKLDLALASYNAGEGAVMRYGNTIPPYPETQHYVNNVISYYKQLQNKQPLSNLGDLKKTNTSTNKFGDMGQLWEVFTRG